MSDEKTRGRTQIGDCEICGTEAISVTTFSIADYDGGKLVDRLIDECEVCANMIGDRHDTARINLAICTNIVLRELRLPPEPPSVQPDTNQQPPNQ